MVLVLGEFLVLVLLVLLLVLLVGVVVSCLFCAVWFFLWMLALETMLCAPFSLH